MAASLADDFINVLLVGKTGEGKSSTGNSIIGKKLFNTGGDFSSNTKLCQKEVAKVQGHNVVVVDSPGLADTDLNSRDDLMQLATEVTTVLATQPDGFDAILIVTRYGARLTEEDKLVFQKLEAFFGTDYTKQYGILIVTCADNYDPEENDDMALEEFLNKQTGLFQEMREKCNNRLVAFDNKTRDQSVRQNQIKRLLEIVTEMRKEGRYTPEIFQAAGKSREEAFFKVKEPYIKKETQNFLKLITQDIDDIPEHSKDVAQLREINQKLQRHRKDLTDQDAGRGQLVDLTSTISKLEEAIEAKITAIKENRDNRTSSESLARQNTALNSSLVETATKELSATIAAFAGSAVERFLYHAISKLNPALGMAWDIAKGALTLAKKGIVSLIRRKR